VRDDLPDSPVRVFRLYPLHCRCRNRTLLF